MTADTIVLIHGLFMTPRYWDAWVPYYEKRGFRVLTPAYPGLDAEVEVLRADPSPIAALDVAGIAAHLADVVSGLDSPPIIMGHSYGGLFTQLLLDRGFGAVGVSIHGQAPKGVLAFPPAQLRASWPALRSPANRRRAVAFSFKQFHYAFCNTLGERDARVAYDSLAVPAPGRLFFEAALAAVTRDSPSTVDFGRSDRAPLLHVTGAADHIVPAVIGRRTYRKYAKSGANVNALRVWPGRSHYSTGEPGWEEIADFALDWAVAPRAGVLE